VTALEGKMRAARFSGRLIDDVGEASKRLRAAAPASAR
jgi:hypothetical protein